MRFWRTLLHLQQDIEIQPVSQPRKMSYGNQNLDEMPNFFEFTKEKLQNTTDKVRHGAQMARESVKRS